MKNTQNIQNVLADYETYQKYTNKERIKSIAKEVNMIPDELIGNLGDVHLYLNHIEQAKEQIGREPFELPKLIIKHSILEPVELIHKLENYQSHPTIKAPLSN